MWEVSFGPSILMDLMDIVMEVSAVMVLTCLWNVQGYNDVTRNNEPISVTFDKAQDLYGHSPRHEVDALWMPRVVDILVLAGWLSACRRATYCNTKNKPWRPQCFWHESRLLNGM